jgi:hypothetical protein
MYNLESKIGKKVLAWALVFALTLSVIPYTLASHDEDNTINIENGVFPWDSDNLSNDLLFYAHTSEVDVDEILINVWKKNAIGNWDFYDDGETNESGELSFFNVTAGEYLWDAYDGNTKLENEGGFAKVDSTYLVGHVGILEDIDGEDDFDDFLAYILEVNGTSDDGYVEIYDEYDNLVDEGYTDEELDDNFTAFLSTDLDMGNYTHYIFDEFNGTLLQNGSFYSYGSYNTTSTGDSDEWFEDWDYELEDRDGDNQSDIIVVSFNPDTNSTEEIEVYVDFSVYNSNGSYIGGEGDYFDIDGTETEYFDFEWGLEDCYYEDEVCESSPYSFDFRLRDEGWNDEDSFWINNITLYEMGMPDDVIQVDGGSIAWDEDELHNDVVALALVLDYAVENVSYELEKKVLGVWIDAGNATTDDDGFVVISNQTDGEYRWNAYYENEEIDDGWFILQASSTTNIGHVGYFSDLDDDDDFDDFEFIIVEDNRTSTSGSYVEIFYENNNTLYESGTGDISDDEELTITFYDVPEGNYTFELYYEEDGDLLQTGWLHSYGSETEHIDYWFEDHNYTLEDSNGDGEYNNVTINYEIGTDSQEEEEVRVEININSDDGNGGYDSYEYEITANQTNAFQTDTFTFGKNGTYTFEIWLYDDDWNDYDYFNFEVYLECDENFTECDFDEWFEDWDYETEDTDGDNLVDTIDISYDPNTDCDCEMDVEVGVSVYENSTGDWVDSEYDYHTINGTVEEYFEQSWTTHESQSYDFYVYMVDEEGDFEDSFWIYGIYLYQTSGAGGPGDEDEYFDYVDTYTYDSDNDGYEDTVEVNYDPDTTCDCNITVELVFDVYDNTTGSWINGTKENYTIYKDDDDYLWNEWSPEYNGTFDFYLDLYDEDGNLEDEMEYLGVELHVRSNGGGGDDNGSSDEWFEERDYDVNPSDTINIGYDPNTDCDCEVRVWTYIDVYQDGYKIDTISDDYYVYSTYYDWFEQSWTADENDTYDFYVVLFDGENGPDNFEDDFWIYDVYLSSDDGGGGNQTDDGNGVGHIGLIDNFDDDDYVNDYIGGVLEDDEYKEDAYFEIYDENGNLIDSGNPNYYGMLFVSFNLTEGWYQQQVFYEENGVILQEGPFYSYGNSSDFTVVNVDNAVVDDDEYSVYDDVGFIAHQGSSSEDDGVENVEIEISKLNNTSGNWEYHASLVTNASGEAWLYNENCGEYEWTSNAPDNGPEDNGYYEVWAHCDDGNGTGGGDNETKDYDEWFNSWEYWGKNNANDEHIWNELIIGYNPDTDCDCEINVTVEMYVEKEDGNWSDYSNINHTIYQDYDDWFENDIEVEDPGRYNFYFDIWDDKGNHEDSFEFSLIMSDEWFDDEWYEDSGMVMVDLHPGTNYDGEIYTSYDFYVERYNEDENYWEWLEHYSDDAWISGSNDNGQIHFEWTANESGEYRFMAVMYDEYGNMESIVDYEAQINLNSAPIIDELMNINEAYEGQMIKYEVSVMDDDTELQIHWDMGDGTIYENAGLDLFHIYADDGIYEVTITADDGSYITIEMFDVEILNAAPLFTDVMFDALGNEGDIVSFNAQVTDVPSDEVTVTWTFPDGSTSDSLFAQYVFTDDGEFIVLVTASDEDGGESSKQIMVTIENVAPIFTEFQMPSAGQEGEALDFNIAASDPGDDTVVYTINFGDGTSPLITQDGGNITHKFADGDTFTIIICAADEDGGETCREQILPVSIIEQLEDGGLPGFNLLAVISALGVISILRRRTH